MKKLAFLLMLIPVFCYSQLSEEQERQIDSLKQVIANAEQDTLIINAWEAWEEIIRISDPVTSLELNQNIVNLCEQKLNDSELPAKGEVKKYYQQKMSYAFDKTGWFYFLKGDYTKAMDNYTRSLTIDEAIENKFGIAMSLNLIANIYTSQGDYTKAIDYYTRSLTIREELGNKLRIASTLNNIGNIYENQGDYAKAIDYHTRSLKIKEELGDKSGISMSLNNIGNIYYDQEDYAKSLDYHTRSLKIKEELGDKAGIAMSLSNIGLIYYYQGDYAKSLEYHTRSLKISEEIRNKSGIAMSLNNIGLIYYKQGDNAKALDYHTRSLKISEEIGLKSEIAVSLNNIGNIYYEQGDYTKAIQYSNRSYKLAVEIGELLMIEEASESLYKSYKKTNKPSLALRMYEQFITARDSLESEENQREVLRQEYKYEYEKQALADSIQLAQERRVIQAELAIEKQRANFLYAGLALALFFGGFIYNRFRVTSKQKRIIEDQKKIVESEKEKSDGLLLNILPKDTARELKQKGSVAARSYDSATIFFADFKAFTQLAEQMKPVQLVQLLNECYSAFDDIMVRNGIEKIKTIGDAYMASGGVPTPNGTHAKDTLKAALEIQAFMQQHAEKKKRKNEPFFEARIGIHTGPIVTGVVGKNKFQYDVWGDTVNIASRLESNSEVGKINISAATYELVKDMEDLAFTSRGQIEVKGKGAMGMYFVETTH